MDICGDQAVYIPPNDTCDECAQFERRLSALERMLQGASKRTITAIGSDGSSTTAEYIGFERSS